MRGNLLQHGKPVAAAGSAAHTHVGSSLFTDTVWIGFSQLGVLTAKLIGLRLLTEVFPAHIYGEAGLLLAVVALGLASASTPLVQAMMRAYPEISGHDDLGRLRRSSMQLLGWSVAVQLLLVVAVLVLWPDRAGRPSLLAVLGVVALILVESLRSFETGLLTADRQQRRYAVWNALDAWARPACALLLGLLVTSSAEALVWGYVLACAAMLVLFSRWRIGTELGSARIAVADPVLRASMLRYAVTLAPLAPIAWMLSSADRFVLASYAGTEPTGMYIAAYGLGSAPMLALSMVLLTVFRPILYRCVANGDRAGEVKLLLRWGVIYVVLAVLGLCLIKWLAPVAAQWFLAASFRSVDSLIPWVAAAYALQGLQVVFETRIMAWNLNKRLWLLQLLGGVSALGLYAVLIPRYGMYGAALATLVSMSLTCVCAAILARLPVARVQSG